MAAGREIRVRIRGIQYDNPEPVETVQEVQASYFFRAGAHYLLYEEQPEGFDQVIKTRVKRRGEYLEVNRQGSMGGSMVFKPGKTFRTEYATPFGILLLDIVTETVEIVPEPVDGVENGSRSRADVPDDDAGNWQNVKIKYSLINQGETLGEYELYIERI